jgi:hypothetical protein
MHVSLSHTQDLLRAQMIAKLEKAKKQKEEEERLKLEEETRKKSALERFKPKQTKSKQKSS